MQKPYIFGLLGLTPEPKNNAIGIDSMSESVLRAPGFAASMEALIKQR
jgi:hypothetical protein